MLAKSVLFTLAGVSQRVRNDATACLDIVLLAMQVTMQPPLRLRQQITKRVAEACCAWGEAIARVGTAQARSKVRHHHRVAVKWRRQGLAQPLLAQQALLAPALREPRFAAPGRAGFAQIEIGGTKS